MAHARHPKLSPADSSHPKEKTSFSHVSVPISHFLPFTWEIKSHDEREHGNVFYIIVLTAIILLLIFSVWQKDFLFGVFILLAGGTILFLSAQPPRTHIFKLSEDTFSIDGEETKYAYDRFSGFDLYEFSPTDWELFLAFRERYRPILRARVHRSDAETIKEFLSKKLPQRKMEPSLLDIFSKIVGI